MPTEIFENQETETITITTDHQNVESILSNTHFCVALEESSATLVEIVRDGISTTITLKNHNKIDPNFYRKITAFQESTGTNISVE